MTYLKTLGLALVAMLAMSAFAAASASAQHTGELTTEEQKDVTLDITETGEPGDNIFHAFGGTVDCVPTSYVGHEVDTTEPHELIEHGATQATITPSYGPCIANEFPATVNMTDCDYVFEIGSETQAAGTYGVTADVVCDDPSEGIHVEVFSGEAHGFKVCDITVTDEENDSLSGPHLTNDNGDIDIVGTFNNVHAEESGLCETATDAEATLVVDATISGTDDEEEPTDISISG